MKRLICIFISLMMVMSLVACGDSTTNNEETTKKAINILNGKITANKILSVDKTLGSIEINEGTLVYKDDTSKKYGIISLETQNDTGAIFTDVYNFEFLKQGYVIASSTETGDNKSFSNAYGLYDSEGKNIIPEEYYELKVLNARYVYVEKITETTKDKNEAILTSDKTNYKGEWMIFDLSTNNFVNNISGTKIQTVTAEGRFIKVGDDNNKIIYDEQGNVVDYNVLNNGKGIYTTGSGENTIVYSADGKELFAYNSDIYTEISATDIGLFLMTKSDGSNKKYVFLDSDGKEASALFDRKPELAGDKVLVENTFVNLDGTTFVSGTYSEAHYDEFSGSCWMLVNKGNTEHTLVDKDGNILHSDMSPYADDDDFLFDKSYNHDTSAFSLKDKNYTLTGDGVSPLCIKSDIDKDNIYNLVSTIDGSTILSDYKSYKYYSSGSILVAKKDNSLDIYSMNFE